MLNIKQFILISMAVVVGSVSFATVLSSQNLFSDLVVYQKSAPVTALSYTFPEPLTVIATNLGVEQTKKDQSIEVTEADEVEETAEPVLTKSKKKTNLSVPIVPFYSQFDDITANSWKKVGCGIAGLAMLIEYYNPGVVNVDTLLQEGIDANAYLDSAGWTYAGLIGVSKKYGMGGEVYDYGDLSMEKAFDKLVSELEEGPVMASVHYTFERSNPIPHLVIINGIEDGKVFYNDPAEKRGGGSISVAQFQSAWKKRYIEFRLS